MLCARVHLPIIVVTIALCSSLHGAADDDSEDMLLTALRGAADAGYQEHDLHALRRVLTSAREQWSRDPYFMAEITLEVSGELVESFRSGEALGLAALSLDEALSQKDLSLHQSVRLLVRRVDIMLRLQQMGVSTDSDDVFAERAEALVNLLLHIEEKRNPKWDPAQLPPAYPPRPSGFWHPGVPLEEIADANLRREYQSVVAQHREQVRTYQEQQAIADLLEWYPRSARGLLRSMAHLRPQLRARLEQVVSKKMAGSEHQRYLLESLERERKTPNPTTHSRNP